MTAWSSASRKTLPELAGGGRLPGTLAGGSKCDTPPSNGADPVPLLEPGLCPQHHFGHPDGLLWKCL